MGSIVFPAMTTASEAKVKRLIDSMNEYMGADISYETCIVMRVNFPDERKDVECVVQAILSKWKEK